MARSARTEPSRASWNLSGFRMWALACSAPRRMDKAAMKALFTHAGLPLGPFASLRGRDALAEQDALAALGLPVFVKPANMGSSVGISKVYIADTASLRGVSRLPSRPKASPTLRVSTTRDRWLSHD